MISALLAPLARAGGGQGFGGGSGGGGGFGGGSGGVGGGGGGFGVGGAAAGAADIIVLFGVVGFIVVGVLVAGFLSQRRGGLASGPEPEEPAGPGGDLSVEPPQVPAAALEAGLAAIRAHDPGFDAERFRADVERCFLAVQKAWSDRDPAESQLVMSVSLWHAHRIQILGYRNLHKRNRLDGLRVTRITLLAASGGSTKDTITTRIQARSADYDVDDSGKMVRGDRAVRPWAEDWVFQRSATATTAPAGDATSPAVCANCGAALELDDDGACRFCKTVAMASDVDWTVVRIDQIASAHERERLIGAAQGSTATLPAAATHRAPGPAALPGVDLAPITAHDPAFEAQDFLAMARAAFFTVEHGIIANEPGGLGGIVGPELLARLGADAAADRAAHRRRHLDVLQLRDAVIAGAQADGGTDRLRVRFSPRAADYVTDGTSPAAPDASRERHAWDEEWVFERPAPQGSFRPAWLVVEIGPRRLAPSSTPAAA